jgi:glycosyltransferase involved in cell wall biosynthesis
MIVKNEEEVLANCLESASKICDEIIIVDTGSEDNTKEIAKRFTNKIYDFEWIDDFSAARNYSYSLATKEYILLLDADDVLLPEDQKRLKELKKNLKSDVDVVTLNYVLATDEKGNPTFHYRQPRLVKRSKGYKWIGPVHEYLAAYGITLNADISVHHKKQEKTKVDPQAIGRNLRIYENRLKRGEEFTARDLFYYANELKDHGQYENSLIYYQKFLDGKKGWIEDNIRACLYMADCYAQLNEQESQLTALLKSFIYDEPRSETCCRLGDVLQSMKNFQTAVFWYNTADRMKDKVTSGFNNTIYTTWYPHLSLCVCHWQLGNIEESIKHHEITKIYIPNDPKVVYNEEFFKDYMKDKENSNKK